MSISQSLSSTTSFDFVPNLPIKVFYLEAPLSFLPEKSIQELASVMLTLDGYHTGIGFVVGDISFILDYTATPSMIGALLPDITELNKGNLQWDDDAIIETGITNLQDWDNPQYPGGYWKKSTYLCTINRNQFLQLKDMIVTDYIPKHLHYSLLALQNAMGNVLARSSTCDGFCLYVFQALQDKSMDVEFDFLTFPNVSTFTVYTNSPVIKMDVNNVDDKNEILKFYGEVYALIPDSTHTILSRFMNILGQSAVSLEQLLSTIGTKDAKFFQMLQAEIFMKLKTIVYYSYDNDTDSTMSYYKVVIDSIKPLYGQYELRRDIKDVSISDMSTKENFMNTISPRNKNLLVIMMIIFFIVILGITVYVIHKKNK